MRRVPGAYYNEIDEYAAAWLRNLIRDGHIASGDVDTRSIEDVKADDLRGYTQCHFFAGVGLWSYALRRAGWADDRPIWTGSCPCQPFSAAGKGAKFDDERHLWPAWFHLVTQCRPTAICGEQVASKDGYGWLDLVQTDLEGMAYAFWPVVLPIAGVGGPGERHRIWWVGLADDDGERCEILGSDGVRRQQLYDVDGRGPGIGMADPARGHAAVDAWDRARPGATPGTGPTGGLAGRGTLDGMADADHQHDDGSGRGRPVGGHEFADGGTLGGMADGAGERRGETGRALAIGGEPIVPPDGGSGLGVVGDAERAQLERHAGDGDGAGRREVPDGPIAAASIYERVADAELCGREQQSSAEPPSLFDETGAGGLFEPSDDSASICFLDDGAWTGPLNGFWRDADWLFCTDGKWRPVEPGTRPLAYGLPLGMGALGAGLAGLCRVAGVDGPSLKRAKAYRVGTLRGYGNAISPEPAIEFILSWRDMAA